MHIHSYGASAIPVEIGSRNVYRDLGLRDADALLAKAELVTALSNIIAACGCNRSKARGGCGCSARMLRRLRRSECAHGYLGPCRRVTTDS